MRPSRSFALTLTLSLASTAPIRVGRRGLQGASRATFFRNLPTHLLLAWACIGCGTEIWEPPGFLAVVEGSVVASDGQPIPQATIVVEAPPGTHAGASVTGTTGFFRVNLSNSNAVARTLIFRIRVDPPPPYQSAMVDTLFRWNETPGSPPDTLVVFFRLSQ